MANLHVWPQGPYPPSLVKIRLLTKKPKEELYSDSGMGVPFGPNFTCIGLKKTIIFSQTIPEENNEDEVFDDDAIEDVDLEELEYAFDHFLDKLEALVQKLNLHNFYN